MKTGIVTLMEKEIKTYDIVKFAQQIKMKECMIKIAKRELCILIYTFIISNFFLYNEELLKFEEVEFFL